MTITTTVRRTVLVVAFAAVSGAACVPAASAHEPAAHVNHLSPHAWSEPQAALGGISLAVYVARHQARALGPVLV